MNTNLPVRQFVQSVQSVAPQPLPPPAESTRSLRDIGTILVRHSGKSFAFLLATIVTAAVIIMMQQRSYTAEALLMVRQGRDSVSLDPTATTGNVYPTRRDWQNTLNSELAIIDSEVMAEAVVDRIGADAILHVPTTKFDRLTRGVTGRLFGADSSRSHEAHTDQSTSGSSSGIARATTVLRESMRIRIIPDSDVIQVSCSFVNPQIACDSIAALLSLYQDKHTAVHRTAGSFAFFNKETSELRESLRQAENKLSEKMNIIGAVDVDSERRAVSSRLAILREQQDATQLDTEAALARYQDLHSKVNRKAGVTRGLLPGAMREMKSSLLQAETDLKVQLRSNRILTKQVADAVGNVERLNKEESSVRALEREIQIAEQKYFKYSDHMEQARIDDALETDKISNISIIQPPTVPDYADNTNASLILFLAAVLGVGGGLGIAFVSENIDQSVRAPEHVESHADLAVLGSVPLLRREDIAPRRYRRPSKRDESRELHPTHRETTAPFSRLARHLLNCIDGHTAMRPIMVGITSCDEGEGTSTVAMQLSIALTGSREDLGHVMLIEPNASYSRALPFRPRQVGPRATEFFRSEGGKTAMRQQNIYSTQPEAPDELPMERMTLEEVVLRARSSSADIAVFDLPPLSDGGAAEGSAPLLDYMLLVAESERTRWQSLRKAKQTLQEARGEVLGAVLNKRRYYLPEWLYQRL